MKKGAFSSLGAFPASEVEVAQESEERWVIVPVIHVEIHGEKEGRCNVLRVGIKVAMVR